MRTILSLATTLLLSVCTIAQNAPQKFNYQAVARDANGHVIANADIDLQIAIMSANDLDRPVYAEQHSVTTSKLGLFSLAIGGGEAMEGDMRNIDWGSSAHFLSIKMDVDRRGNFQELGISQLLSVPYALYAEKSGSSAFSEDGSSRNDPNDWSMDGNTGTDENLNFIGTTDEQDLVLKTNGSEVARFTVEGDIQLSANASIKAGTENILNAIGTRNIHIGRDAGAVSTGSQNSFIGSSAGMSNTTGYDNAFIGPGAGRDNTTGYRNVFIGFGAGRTNTTGYRNSFIGGQAGFSNTDGFGNSGIGFRAGYANTTGIRNTFVGDYAGQSNTTGYFNTYVGKEADGAPDIFNATAIGAGAYAAESNTVILGNGVNVGIGTSAPQANLHVVGGLLVDDGNQTNGFVLATDSVGNATWTDPYALIEGDNLGNHTATQNVRLNDKWLSNDGDNEGIKVASNGDILMVTNPVTGSSQSLFVPGHVYLAPYNGSNVAYLQARRQFDTGNLDLQIRTTYSSAIVDAMRITGNGNVGIGTTSPDARLHVNNGQIKITGGNPGTNKVLTSDATGLASWVDPNSLVNSGQITDADNDTKIQVEANADEDKIRFTLKGTERFTMDTLGALRVIAPNLIVGDGTGGGIGNTLIGSASGSHITSASYNTSLGSSALRNHQDGQSNVAVGNGALNDNVSGSSNVAIGYGAGGSNLGGANVFVGYRAGSSETGSNKLYISNASSTAANTLIYGDFGLKILAVDGNLGVGTITPAYKLDVDGIGRFTSNLYVQSNIGIGTTTPAYKLDVNGNGRFASDLYAQSRIFIGNNGTGSGAPLYVNGTTVTTPNSARAYFNVGSGVNIVQDVNASGLIQVEAAGYYWANGGGYVATSDARIKNIIGQTDTETDLNTLRQIEITDYTYIDWIQNGTTEQKKVIAQQVQSVFPNAITTMKGIIPSVYATAASVTTSGNTTEVVTTKPHGFNSGDRVKLILEQGSEKMMEVAVIDGNTFTVAEPLEGNVFVYGKHVDDLLTVDYDALTTLNISATQELADLVFQLRQENEALKAELKAERSENQARLEVIEQQLGIGLKAQR